MKNTLEYAQELYSQGKFKEALDVALSIGVTGEQAANMAVCLLIAKLNLILLVDPLKKDSHDSFFKMLTTACSFASSVEDVWHIQREIYEAITAWEIDNYQMHLNVLKENPSDNDVVQVIIHLPIDYLESIVNPTTVLFQRDPLVQDFIQKNNLTANGSYLRYLKENLDIPRSLDIPKNAKARMDIDAATYIFVNAKEKCAALSNTSMEYINHHRKSLCLELMYSAILVGEHAKTPLAILYDLYEKALILHADINNYLLSAVVSVNGRASSLYTGPREQYIADLKKDYAALSEIDSTFTPPPIPSVQVTPPQKSGCYVATAVYGSYDCPEVWTLRRFRDYTLAETWYGRAFIYTYYAISPSLVKCFGDSEWFKNLWKPTLDRMVKRLNCDGVENTPYNDRIW